MPTPLLECIPNFSEGRRGEIIEAILGSIRGVSGAHILDSSSDPDHNRTVVTMAGHPTAIENAALAAIACAAERIDLRRHAGVHPRIGATDVVPLVPLQGMSMQECVGAARALGRRVGEELKLPVYLYGEAAIDPERKQLSEIRKGEFEGLAEAIGSDPARRPDYGPARLGPAGATAIGARGPLIAFNIYLATPDIEIARSVAVRIRTSSGGLPAVKALGLLVGGRAQVSMNLIDYRFTSLPQVFAAVQSEAHRLGAEIDCSELIGLIPVAATLRWTAADIRLVDFSENRILENRLNTLGLLEG